jgi:hypothetical protein
MSAMATYEHSPYIESIAARALRAPDSVTPAEIQIMAGSLLRRTPDRHLSLAEVLVSGEVARLNAFANLLGARK